MEATDIGFLIKGINDKIKVKADASLKSHDLTLAQCRVLGFLHENGGHATQKEIEGNLEVSHPTIVGIVSRIEQNGYVESWFDPQDRRNKIVQLTDKAESIGEEMTSIIAEQERKITKGLSASEVKELKRMLAVIYRTVM